MSSIGWAVLIAVSTVLGALATYDAWPGRTRYRRKPRTRHLPRKRSSSRRPRTRPRKKG